jgi:hypothetical protein
MDIERRDGFWRRTPPPARPAFIAAIVVLVVGLGTFVVLVPIASISLGVSPMTAIFGPGPGNPLILWLFFAVPAILLQGAVALELRHPSAGMRTAGAVGALGIAGLCLLWLLAVGIDLIAWLATGALPGDLFDLLGMLFFGVPFAVAVGLLNARAGLLSSRPGGTPHQSPGGAMSTPHERS